MAPRSAVSVLVPVRRVRGKCSLAVEGSKSSKAKQSGSGSIGARRGGGELQQRIPDGPGQARELISRVGVGTTWIRMGPDGTRTDPDGPGRARKRIARVGAG